MARCTDASPQCMHRVMMWGCTCDVEAKQKEQISRVDKMELEIASLKRELRDLRREKEGMMDQLAARATIAQEATND